MIHKHYQRITFAMKINAERQVIITRKHYQALNNIMLSVKQYKTPVTASQVLPNITITGRVIRLLLHSVTKPNLQPALTVPTMFM